MTGTMQRRRGLRVRRSVAPWAAALMLWALAGSMEPAAAQPAATAAGQQIAAQGTAAGVPACASCHGARGEGAAAFPRLAGTGQAYLRRQLEAFADGSRKSPVMQPFAQKLTAEQRAQVTAYYSGLPAPFVVREPASASPAQTGQWLAMRGRWRDQLPGCVQCHGPGGVGVGSNFPPLAGLPADYLRAQLQAFKDGSRPAGPVDLMGTVAGKLTQADMEAVSSYYAQLGAAPAQAAASAPRQAAASAPQGATR